MHIDKAHSAGRGFELGLGGGVEVLGPPELRAEIAGRLREAVAWYGDMTA
jgi:hypothetical protein